MVESWLIVVEMIVDNGWMTVDHGWMMGNCYLKMGDDGWWLMTGGWSIVVESLCFMIKGKWNDWKQVDHNH